MASQRRLSLGDSTNRDRASSLGRAKAGEPAAPDPAAFGNLPQQALFQGRPDMKHVLGDVKRNGIARHAVYCCGPNQLVNSTWEATSALSDAAVQFAFHHETFEF